MLDIENVFECSLCGEVRPIRELSRDALHRAGTTNRTQAVMVLDPSELVCQQCQDDDDEYDAEYFHGRTDVERFELSGITLDPARLQAYLLNN
jgi:hypothetical protein